MSTLSEYIKTMVPIRGVIKVRYEIENKAKQISDKCYPDDAEKNKICHDSYLLGMYETLELVYY